MVFQHEIWACAGRCEPGETLSFVMTMFGAAGAFEKKEYWVKIQVPASTKGSGAEKMITLGKVAVNMAEFGADVQVRLRTTNHMWSQS